MTRYSIRVSGSDRAIVLIEAPATEGYVIGRSDEASNYIPDIDLASFDAREKGVSRRHAALVRFEGKTHVIDLNSVNGTYLDGKRLSPDVPHPLRTSSELRLGTLSLTISTV